MADGGMPISKISASRDAGLLFYGTIVKKEMASNECLFPSSFLSSLCVAASLSLSLPSRQIVSLNSCIKTLAARSWRSEIIRRFGVGGNWMPGRSCPPTPTIVNDAVSKAGFHTLPIQRSSSSTWWPGN